MAATLLSAVATCLGSLFLGQAALRLAGAREWSWLAPMVGISIAMLIAVTAIHAPGHCLTVAILMGSLTIAAAIWCLGTPEHTPPVSGLLAAAPVALMALIPYAAVWHAGIPGVGVDNDMATHLLWAEGILSPSTTAVWPLSLDYPLGPHASAAVIAKGLDMRIDAAFAGWIVALPVLNAWTALALVRRASWLGKALVATVVGMPFLIAAYYGEGSFKEVLLAGIVIALVALLGERRPVTGLGRWVPFALLVGGVLSVYSIAGLPWPLLIAGVWLAVLAVRCVLRGGRGPLWATFRRELPSVGLAAGVLLVLLVPQIPRLIHFVSLRESVNGTGIEASTLGNLAAPIPGWEAFGVWGSADFRYPPPSAFTAGMWTAFVLMLVLVGVVWALRRGRWVLPAAAVVTMLIWVLSVHSQSPYVAAKALVMASPLLLALAVLPLAEKGDWWPGWRALAPILAVVLLYQVGATDLRTLRFSPIGPTGHLEQLRSLRQTIDGQPTLFLGNDDFIDWELAGVSVGGPVGDGVQRLPIPPGKKWSPGEALDFDSVDAATLNSYQWVITTRDAAASEPPPQLHLVRDTADYSLWRREGTVRARSVLDEGQMAAAPLRCGSAAGRRVLRQGGIAALRQPWVAVPAPVVVAGTTALVRLPLYPGRWALEAPYSSPLEVEVSGPGLHTTLPPNLDRTGPRWPVGTLDVRRQGTITIAFHVDKTHLTPNTDAAQLGALVATPLPNREPLVPIRRACGSDVDWHRSSSQ